MAVVKKPDPPTPSLFEAAKERWEEVRARFTALQEAVEGMKLALTYTHNATDLSSPRSLPERHLKLATPFLDQAKKRRSRLVAELEECELQMVDLNTAYAAEAEVWKNAQRSETDRIAAGLQPRQMAAVSAMARALEDFSRAATEAFELNDDLRKRAPLQDSRFLPDVTTELVQMILADRNSWASQWARRMRKIGVLS